MREVSDESHQQPRFLESPAEIQNLRLRLLHPLRAAGHQLRGHFRSERGGEAGYGIKIGGGLLRGCDMAQVLPVFLKPEQVWPVVKAVSGASVTPGYRLKRTRARFKFLVDDCGKLAAARTAAARSLAEKVEERLNFKLDRFHDIPIIDDEETDHLGIPSQKQGASSGLASNFPGGRVRDSRSAQVGGLAAKYCAPGKDRSADGEAEEPVILNVLEANLPES